MTPDRKTLLTLYRRLAELGGGRPVSALLADAGQYLADNMTGQRPDAADPVTPKAASLLLAEIRRRPLTDVLGPLYVFAASQEGTSLPAGRFPPQSVTDSTAAIMASSKPWIGTGPGIIPLAIRDAGAGAQGLSLMKAVAREADPRYLQRIQFIAVDPDPLCAAFSAAQMAANRNRFLPEAGINVFLGAATDKPADWKPVAALPCKLEAARLKQMKPAAPPSVTTDAAQQLSFGF